MKKSRLWKYLLTKWTTTYQALWLQVCVWWYVIIFLLSLYLHAGFSNWLVVRLLCGICGALPCVMCVSARSCCGRLIWITLAHVGVLSVEVIETWLINGIVLTVTSLVVVPIVIHERGVLVSMRIVRISCAKWRAHYVWCKKLRELKITPL